MCEKVLLKWRIAVCVIVILAQELVKRKLLSGRAAREVVEGFLLEGHGVGIDDIPIHNGERVSLSKM